MKAFMKMSTSLQIRPTVNQVTIMNVSTKNGSIQFFKTARSFLSIIPYNVEASFSIDSVEINKKYTNTLSPYNAKFSISNL